MKSLSLHATIGLGLVLGALVGCSSSDSSSSSGSRSPFVNGVDNSTTDAPKPSISPITAADGANLAVRSKVSLSLDAIRGTTFLYGSDLQYSGINNGATQSSQSTIAIGHVPVKFVDLGDRLQLLEDQSFLFESDVNHPARLLHEFPITSRSGSSVTIEVQHGSPALATIIESSTDNTPRSSWVRSVKFVPADNLLMFETSIEASDGTIYEFMESLFPRESLVPDGYVPLSGDPSVEPLASRFHFIENTAVYVDNGAGARVETQFAPRWNVKAGQVVNWYVTANIPDEFLPDVKQGVEGWNRYSQAMWHKDIIAFKGRLPSNITIGDPRYNVINWDTVQDAGAAWESQATDPLTGIQSHSVIYLPLAWFNFGTSVWEDGSLSEVKKKSAMKDFLASRSFLGQKLRTGCYRELKALNTVEVVDDPVTFAHELVRGTLFHEVGHAFGLGHNFEGSLTYDMKTAKTYSSSIMDYNNYDLDRASFDGPTTSTGPLLEYDRQAISALYNGAKDVKDTDPLELMCTDNDVPGASSVGSVSPFCLMYDAGNDPSVFLTKSIDALSNAAGKVGTIDSLPTTLKRVSSKLPAASTILTTDDLEAAAGEQLYHAENVVYYFVGSRVASPALDASYWLDVFTPGSLPSGVVEADVHARAFAAFDAISKLETLSPAAVASVNQIAADFRAWALTTPAVLAMPAAQRAAYVNTVSQTVSSVATYASGSLFPSIRGRVVGTLVHTPALPYAYTKSTNVDYEAKTIALLERMLSTKVANKVRTVKERTKYATALATFRDLDAGNAAASRVAALIQTELDAAPDATTRQALRDLLAALGGP